MYSHLWIYSLDTIGCVLQPVNHFQKLLKIGAAFLACMDSPLFCGQIKERNSKKSLCKKLYIVMIRSRPNHPQAQGKKELIKNWRERSNLIWSRWWKKMSTGPKSLKRISRFWMKVLEKSLFGKHHSKYTMVANQID